MRLPPPPFPHPFTCHPSLQVCERLTRNANDRPNHHARLPRGVHEQLVHLMLELWSTDPDARPTALEAVRRLADMHDALGSPSRTSPAYAAAMKVGDGTFHSSDAGPPFERSVPAGCAAPPLHGGAHAVVPVVTAVGVDARESRHQVSCTVDMDGEIVGDTDVHFRSSSFPVHMALARAGTRAQPGASWKPASARTRSCIKAASALPNRDSRARCCC